MDAELYDLPFWVMQPFQDMGPLGLEEAERGVRSVCGVATSLRRSISTDKFPAQCKCWGNRNSHFGDPKW